MQEDNGFIESPASLNEGDNGGIIELLAYLNEGDNGMIFRKAILQRQFASLTPNNNKRRFPARESAADL
jgi:hypothetical protein